MTNTNHPITPPPELRVQWYTEAENQLGPYCDYIATFAALALALIGLNVFAAVRDNSGVKCYAQPVSEQCQ